MTKDTDSKEEAIDLVARDSTLVTSDGDPMAKDTNLVIDASCSMVRDTALMTNCNDLLAKDAAPQPMPEVR